MELLLCNSMAVWGVSGHAFMFIICFCLGPPAFMVSLESEQWLCCATRAGALCQQLWSAVLECAVPWLPAAAMSSRGYYLLAFTWELVSCGEPHHYLLENVPTKSVSFPDKRVTSCSVWWHWACLGPSARKKCARALPAVIMRVATRLFDCFSQVHHWEPIKDDECLLFLQFW